MAIYYKTKMGQFKFLLRIGSTFTNYAASYTIPLMLQRIVSGGQTGVDRAALDAAIHWDIPCGGWCPRGRLAEDGRIPLSYPLQEAPTADYAERTLLNVQDSDGTLILTHGEPTGGTAVTRGFAAREAKPCLLIDLAQPWKTDAARGWLRHNRIATLNIAGPRESTVPGIYLLARQYLDALLSALRLEP